jgi:site-specific recombinase XerD
MNVPVEVLSTEQVETLLAHPDRDDVLGLRDAAVLATLYYAAATAVEVAGLNLSDVQMRRKQLLLRGEDGARRRVPMVGPLREVLSDYQERSRRLLLAQRGGGSVQVDAFFLGNKAMRIKVQDVRQLVGSNAKAAGLETAVNLNTLRLSRAWHLREEGRSPESIQRFLGATSRSGRNVI